MAIVDLSHVVADGTVTYPGLPAPVIGEHLSREASREIYADGYEFQIGRIEMVTNTGMDPRGSSIATGATSSSAGPRRVRH